MHSMIDLFTGITLGDLTPSQLEAVANNLVISKSSIKSMQELAALADAIRTRSEVSSGIVQGLGGIETISLTDDNASTFTIPANQAWNLIGVQYHNLDPGNATLVEVFLTDGSNRFTCFSISVPPNTKAAIDFSSTCSLPITLSPQLQVEVKQDGSSNGVQMQLVYQVKQI